MSLPDPASCVRLAFLYARFVELVLELATGGRVGANLNRILTGAFGTVSW